MKTLEMQGDLVSHSLESHCSYSELFITLYPPNMPLRQFVLLSLDEYDGTDPALVVVADEFTAWPHIEGKPSFL